MANKKVAQKHFTVSARVNIEVSIVVKANNFYEAVEIGKGMGVHDFVEILGDFVDGEHRVVTVYEND